MSDTLQRLARIMHRLRLRSPATEAEKREWAAIRQAAGAVATGPINTCECADSGCKAAPWHRGGGTCDRAGEGHLFRIDMGPDSEPLVFCGPCMDDALDSGVFAAGSDLGC